MDKGSLVEIVGDIIDFIFYSIGVLKTDKK